MNSATQTATRALKPSGLRLSACSEGGAAHPRLQRREPEGIAIARALSDAAEIEAVGEGEQSWAMIFPAGDVIETRDDRAFSFADREAFVAEYNADEVDAMVDIDHDSVFYDWTPPAEGWVKELRLAEGGAIEARIEWTASGQARLDAKTYRYLSPAFHDDKFGVVTKLHSVALVNQPALTMPAVASRQDAGSGSPDPTAPSPKKDPAMTEDQIASLRSTLGLDETADADAVIAACSALKASADAPAEVDVADFVPRADYDLVAGRLGELEAAQAASDADKPSEAEAAAVVDAAIAAARIAPASRDHYLAICKTADGFNSVKALAATAPRVVPDAAAPDLRREPEVAHEVNDNEAQVIRALGISPKVAAARREKRRARRTA